MLILDSWFLKIFILPSVLLPATATESQPTGDYQQQQSNYVDEEKAAATPGDPPIPESK